MSCSKENVILEAVKEFTGALQSALPLEHWSQFYDVPHLDKVSKQKSKDILAKVQTNVEIEVDETMSILNELYPRFQEIIEQWKAKNKENKTQCDQYLQNQVDFLVSDFRTSIMIKLVSAPDVGLEDLEQFLERRKIVLIGIFEKLSKPGEPQSSVHMKTMLIESLECVKMETLEKQRLQLEQKANDMAEMVLEDAKGAIINIAMQLKSDLNAYHGKNPKDLVKGKLVEINYFMSLKGDSLEKYYPQIYSAILRTTAEVKKCMNEKDYQDMSAEEFAETLHEQLLFDLAREHHMREISFETDLDSTGSWDENACEVSENNEPADSLTAREPNETETQQGQQTELQIDFPEEGVKEEKEDEGGLDQNQTASEMDPKKSIAEAAVIQSEDVGEILEDAEDNVMEERRMHTLQGASENHNKRLIFKVTRTSCGSISRRRSARLEKSRKHAAANHSGRSRQRLVAEIPKSMDGDVDESSTGSTIIGTGSEDSTTDDSDEEVMNQAPPKWTQASTSKSKSNGRKLLQTRRSRLSDDKKGKPNAEKITYLHLHRGCPIYVCNVCHTKCPQNILKYHGENCGKRDDSFACKDCGKRFIGKRFLDRHSRVHTGEKPFKCRKCSERFAYRWILNNHFRLHARAAPFHCEACKLSFVSRRSLHDHNNTMHKEKLPFACRHCDERFSYVSLLKNHVVTHADIRPFQCATCEASFARKTNLAVHIQGVHSYSAQAAQKLANEAAIAYLVKETKDKSYRHISENSVNSLVVSHVIKKENLKLPNRATRNWKSTVHE